MAPKFPGFAECMRLMRKHDPQLREDGFHALLPHASVYIEALITEFETEPKHGLRCWLLELIGAARSPKAFPLFLEYLKSDDASLRYWAIYGLKDLDTKEARRILWEAQSYTFETEEETRYFQQQLRAITGREN